MYIGSRRGMRFLKHQFTDRHAQKDSMGRGFAFISIKYSGPLVLIFPVYSLHAEFFGLRL